MTPERYQLIKSAFFEASAVKGAAREAVLQRHCRDDTALRREVENLLAVHALDTSEVNVSLQPDAVAAVEKAIDQLQREAPTSAASAIRPAPRAEADIPPRIAGYQIERVIGRGGMGTVYAAIQQKPKRTVAIKVMRAGVASRSTLRRFEYETQVLAHLRHPGIAQIYDAGTADTGSGPQPYFAMELLCDAKPITAYVEEKKLNTRARLELMGQICDAVHHAHQKGVIHRDLKPGNIVVDASGQPKILDFGVAKATESDVQVTTMHTDIGQLIGTLAYMSPEQVSADHAELDIRSDVYSLGVVLFELLTGRLPYDLTRKMIHEAARVIREEEPTRLSAVSRVFRGDVETIALKAMEKDKTRRYQSAAELAGDLRRYLNYEPIIGRPPSAIYQLRRFAQRNRALVGGIFAVILALTAGTIVSTWLAIRATAAEKVATEERDRARSEAVRADQTSAFIQTIFQGIDPYQAEGMDTTLLMSLLSKAEKRVSQELSEQPEAEGAIRYTLGFGYMRLARYEDAGQNFDRAEQLFAQHLGPKHPRTINARLSQVDLLIHQGKDEDARPRAAKLIDDFRKEFGDDAPSTLSARSFMAHSLSRTGRFAEAEVIQRDVLQRRIRLFGERSDESSRTMQALAFTLGSKDDEGAELVRKMVDYRTSKKGSDAPWTLEAKAMLAAIWGEQRKLDEANDLFQEVTAGFSRALGPKNTQTLNVMNNHGVALLQNGRFSEAEEVYRRTFEGRREVLGPNHRDTLLSLGNWADALSKQERFEEAESLLRQVLQAQITALDPDHRDVVTAKLHLAMCLQARGQHAAAATLLGERAASLRRTRSESDLSFHVALYNWAATLEDAGDRVAAEPIFREALALHEKHGRPDEAYVAAANNGLGVCLHARGEPSSGDEYQKKGLEMRRRLFGEGHAELAHSLNDIGDAMMDRGDYAAAEPYLRESMSISLANFPPGHHRLAVTQNLWGRCRAGQGAFAEAEEALLAANAVFFSGEVAHKDLARMNLDGLVMLFESWDAAQPNTGKSQKAAEWRAKLQALETARKLDAGSG